jgi:type II secretory pathway component PulL
MAEETIPPTPINLEAILGKLARDRAESEKFAAEQRKLTAEADKFAVEQIKLAREAGMMLLEGEKFRAEATKLWRDWRMAPWLLGLTVIGSVLGALIARHL